uniref:Putative secreted protein n=1 Tax=Ixodes ricinus TaxID=34613 RepID=A0A6B0URG0_IXORI
MTATGEWTEAEKRFFFFLLSSSALGIAPGLCCHMTSSLFTQPSRSNSHFVFGRSFRGCAAERPWWRRGWLVMTSPSLRARRLAVKGTWRGVSGRGGPRLRQAVFGPVDFHHYLGVFLEQFRELLFAKFGVHD